MTTSCPSWEDRKLPLWSGHVIAALPEGHPLCEKPAIQWADLAGQPLLVKQSGSGPEMGGLIAAKLDAFGAQRLLHQYVSFDQLPSLAGAGIGISLMLECATGARYDGVVYREIHDADEPSRFNLAAYWCEANKNPTLEPFLDILRERYPDLSPVVATDRTSPARRAFAKARSVAMKRSIIGTMSLADSATGCPFIRPSASA